MKKGILVVCSIFIIFLAGAVFVLTANKGNVSGVDRIVGSSARYDESLINEACHVVEQKFAEEFEGCTLTELRYDTDIENRFSEEIERYQKEKNQELIVLLSTFCTDENGGDSGFNPNDTYTNWQWHLVRTADKKSWEIVAWGY